MRNKPILYFISICFLIGIISKTQAQTGDGIKISHLPYIQALTDHSVSIIWITNKPAIGWVELAPDDSTDFYLKERPRYFASENGFKNVGTVHRVDLVGLEPGRRYRYRVFSKSVLKHEGAYVDYGRTVATNVYRQEPLEFETLGSETTTHFAMINDIHGRNDVMNKLLDRTNLSELDFVVFNGDMASSLLSEKQMFEDFVETAIERFASEKPFYYARGNHETRGPFATEFPRYFPTPSGHLFYLLRHGETAFIFLDCGEDKPDSDKEYSGIVNMDFYRSQQAQWLQGIVQSPEFKNAKYKIAICHMPPFGGWHGEDEILKKFVPILNKAGVQLMLSAHFHRPLIRQADDIIHFPVIVNDNDQVVVANIDDQNGIFQIIDLDGKVVDEVIIRPTRE